jgi:hypothetical protein
MDEYIRRLLQENLELSRENNKLLHKMRRAAAWSFFFRVLWIAILIGVPVFLYFYIFQPYYLFLQESLGEFQGQFENIPGFGKLFESGNTGSQQ